MTGASQDRKVRFWGVLAIVGVWLPVLAVGLFGAELLARTLSGYVLRSPHLERRHAYFIAADSLKVYNRRFYEERREYFGDWPIPLELFDADKPTPRYLFKPNLKMVLRWGGRFSPARGWWEGVYWSSNSWGFRGPEFSINKPKGMIQIVALGASTTEGSQRDYETYPHFLQQELNRMFPEKRIEVINAGHHGQGIEDLLEILRQRILPLKPDVILFYEVANNIGWNEFLRTPPPCGIGACASMFDSEGPAQLGKRSALFRVMAPRLTGANRLPPPLPHEFDESSPKPNVERYRAALRAIVRECVTHGSRIILSSFITLAREGLTVAYDQNAALFADLHRKHFPYTPGELERIYDHYNRVVRGVAGEFGIPFVDAAREFPRDPKYFPFDIIHFSPEGNRVLAGIFATHLRSEVLRHAPPGGARP